MQNSNLLTQLSFNKKANNKININNNMKNNSSNKYNILNIGMMKVL